MIRKLIIGLAVALLPFALIFGPELPHNIALSRFRSSFPKIAHPTSSALLEQFSAVGLLAGANGNHCDYLVGHVRESDAPQDEITAHYAGKRFPRVDPSYDSGFGADVPLYVEFPGAASDPSGVARYNIPEIIRAARAKQSRKTLYLVYAFDAGYPPNGDWRCH